MAEEIDLREIGSAIADAIRQNYRETDFASPSELEDSVEFIVTDGKVEWFINDYALFLNDGTEYIKGDVFIDNAPEEAQDELEQLVVDATDRLITQILG